MVDKTLVKQRLAMIVEYYRELRKLQQLSRDIKTYDSFKRSHNYGKGPVL